MEPGIAARTLGTFTPQCFSKPALHFSMVMIAVFIALVFAVGKDY